MESATDFEVEECGAVSTETRGMPNGSTEQLGMVKPNGISDED